MDLCSEARRTVEAQEDHSSLQGSLHRRPVHDRRGRPIYRDNRQSTVLILMQSPLSMHTIQTAIGQYRARVKRKQKRGECKCYLIFGYTKLQIV